MLNVFLRLIIALVVGVVVSGFYAGYLDPNKMYILNLDTTLSFLLATGITALLSGLTGCIAASASTDSSDSSHSSGSSHSSSSGSSAASVTGDREEGTVKWFNVSKGFGFITRENGEDIFVHYRSIRGEGRRRLFDGQAVEFSVIDSEKGLQADDIEILS